MGGPVRDGCHQLSTPSVDYADGAEQQVYEILAAADDLSSTCDALVGQAQNWAQRYHLDPARANLLRPLNLDSQARVLEVGAGCGAITRYLGETCVTVDALEPVFSRARVARERTRDLPGVEIFVGDIFDVPPDSLYDLVAVVGVLEYVGNGTAESQPYDRFLEKAASLLSPEGTLLVAIENRVGVKYLAGAPEDHTNRPFDSLEGYPSTSPARTFARDVLVSMVSRTGLTTSVLSAFPDYKLCRVLFADDLVDGCPSLAVSIPQFPSPDWGSTGPRVADEAALWRTMVESGLGGQTPNSFVLLASRSDGLSLWPENQLAGYYPIGRRTAFAVETRVLSKDGDIVFDRRPLRPGSPFAPAGDGPIEIAVTQNRWVEGDDLIMRLAVADDKEIAQWLEQWIAVVDKTLVDGEPAPIDLLPHNLVVQPDGTLAMIDSKFTQVGADRHVVLSRGVLIAGQRLSQSTSPARWGAFTAEGVVQILGAMIGLPFDGSWIPETVSREAAIQTQLSLLIPDAATEEEARARHEEWWWEVLHQPLVSSRQGSGHDGGHAAVEAELGRLGDAYRLLLNSHNTLLGLHRNLIESQRDQLTLIETLQAERQGDIDRLGTELTASEKGRMAAEAEVSKLEQSASWRLTRPFRFVTSRLRNT